MPAEAQDTTTLVITGPGSYGPALAYIARCRTTVGVYTQLLVDAEHEAIIAAPYLQEGHGLAAGPIAEALKAALRRGVNVDIMSTAQGLASLDQIALHCEARGRLRFFRPIANIKDEERLGSHAKFCVVDARHAYIGSANLTGPGLGEHIEIGLFVKGEVARQLRGFWEFCTQIGLFVQIPLP